MVVGGSRSGKLDCDVTIKLLLLGDGAVGKSSILLRFCENKFDHRHIMTIGVDFKFKVVKIGNERVRLQIWDTAGQERFRTITPMYSRSAMGVVLVFDVSNVNSFENVDFWLESLAAHSRPDLAKVLVGNKVDLKDRKITRSQGEALAEKHGIPYFETSALQSLGVDEPFITMASKIREEQLRHEDRTPKPQTIKLDYDDQHSTSWCCGLFKSSGGGSKTRSTSSNSSVMTGGGGSSSRSHTSPALHRRCSMPTTVKVVLPDQQVISSPHRKNNGPRVVSTPLLEETSTADTPREPVHDSFSSE